MAKTNAAAEEPGYADIRLGDGVLRVRKAALVAAAMGDTATLSDSRNYEWIPSRHARS